MRAERAGAAHLQSMSTKLHHGYRLAVGVDPFDFIATVRAHIDPVRDRADARILAERAVAIIDKAAVHGLVTHAGDDLASLMKTPLTAAYVAYEYEQAKLRDIDRRHDPNRFELSFGRDPQTGRFGVLRFADEATLIDAFDAIPEVEEYGYWNNTDRPDDVTEDQWDQRREFWDRVLPGYSAPVEVMLGWSLRSTHHPGPLSLASDRSPLILEELPDLDRRARRAAQDAVSAAAVRAMSESRAVHEITSLVFRTLRTDQYPDVVDAARALLPVDIDFDLLTGNRPLVIEDAETKRAAFLGLAEAAGRRLYRAEGAED